MVKIVTRNPVLQVAEAEAEEVLQDLEEERQQVVDVDVVVPKTKELHLSMKESFYIVIVTKKLKLLQRKGQKSPTQLQPSWQIMLFHRYLQRRMHRLRSTEDQRARLPSPKWTNLKTNFTPLPQAKL
jgi:hypothetical protein